MINTEKAIKGIVCPYCGSDQNHVVDSRGTLNNKIRRQRNCDRCDSRFTTYETAVNDKAVREVEAQCKIVRRTMAKLLAFVKQMTTSILSIYL